MPVYKYRAKKGPVDVIQGTLEAQTEEDAIEKLSQRGYLPLSIEQEISKVVESRVPPVTKVQGKIKSRTITVFSREMASLLKAGVPILKAISTIAEQSEDLKLKSILHDIYEAVKHGDTFSSVLARYPQVFSPLYVAMIRAGENSGVLAEVLLSIAYYRSRQEEIVSRLRMAMAYPLLMGFVGLATVFFMLVFVMPRLMGIFISMGQDLPLPTRILISISYGLRQWWFWIILFLAVVVLVVKQQLKTKKGKSSFGLFALHLPIFGKFILKSDIARFSRTLELLITNGVPILKSIEIAIPVLQNEVLKEQLRNIHKEVEHGGSFGSSLKNSALFPLFMSNLISVGEEAGKLEEALAEVADSYERDVNEAVKIMSNLLEPLMILIMGLIVGFMVIAMLLPIFAINVMAR